MDPALEKKLEKIKTQLVIKHAFFGVLLSMLDMTEDGSIPTMGTDGARLVYNKKFVMDLPDAQLRFVLMHEIMHIAYMHCGNERMLDRDPRKWNYACDFVINLELEDLCKRSEDYQMMPGILVDHKYNNMIAEQVYKQLPENPNYRFAIGRGSCPKCGGTGQHQDKCPKCGGTGVDFADCPSCGGTGQKNGQDCPDCGGSGTEKQVCGTCGGSGGVGPQKPCDCGGQSGGYHEGDLLRPAEPDVLEEMKDKVVQAYEATKKTQGYMPAGLARAIQGLTKSKIPWQKVFHRFVGNALAKDDYSYARPNRRYLSQDLYLPDLRNHIVGNVIIGVDTSGSIGNSELVQFCAELKKISYSVEETTVITCDAAVHEVVKINKMEEFLTKVKFKGGGGTDFRPVFNYVQKHRMQPEILIYLTDSYGTFPETRPRYPVIWILTDKNGEGNIPWGEKAVIPNVAK